MWDWGRLTHPQNASFDYACCLYCVLDLVYKHAPLRMLDGECKVGFAYAMVEASAGRPFVSTRKIGHDGKAGRAPHDPTTTFHMVSSDFASAIQDAHLTHLR